MSVEKDKFLLEVRKVDHKVSKYHSEILERILGLNGSADVKIPVFDEVPGMIGFPFQELSQEAIQSGKFSTNHCNYLFSLWQIPRRGIDFNRFYHKATTGEYFSALVPVDSASFHQPTLFYDSAGNRLEFEGLESDIPIGPEMIMTKDNSKEEILRFIQEYIGLPVDSFSHFQRVHELSTKISPSVFAAKYLSFAGLNVAINPSAIHAPIAGFSIPSKDYYMDLITNSLGYRV